MYKKNANFINDEKIWKSIEENQNPEAAKIKEVLAKATEMKGLSLDDVSVLTGISDPEMLSELFETANKVKETIYGKRLVIFAPLYISNLCANECLYCAFRATNKDIVRSVLPQHAIENEVRTLINQGQKRVLLVAGESYPKQGFQYVLDAIETIYGVKTDHGEVRRVNINVAPLKKDEFKTLKGYGIGTYQIFQETYHRETYEKVHLKGQKADYLYRLYAMHRAYEADIDDVGIGALF
ncbi:MAG: radical SAM protein, partial [Draconibacterium sp.]|nr:radical SAM protein [Draconibacterium sp.]